MAQASNPKVTLLCFFSQFFTVTFSGDSAGCAQVNYSPTDISFAFAPKELRQEEKGVDFIVWVMCLSTLLFSR